MSLTYQYSIKITALCLVLMSCSSEQDQSSDSSDLTTAQEMVGDTIIETQEEPLDSTQQTPIDIDELTIVVEGQTVRDLESLDSVLLPTQTTPSESSSPEVEMLAEGDSSKPEMPYCLGAGQVDEEVIDSACLDISNRLASVSNDGCLAANLKLSQCQSVDKFPILYSEFSPLNGKAAQGKILVVGGIHGDELTSVSMVFRWIEKLNQYHTGLFHWHMVPMMNPDGVLKSGATRTNANGVDLNRNLPSDDWREKALRYWQVKTDKNERRYPGEHPASEPETQWLIDEINSFKPDAIIAVHAPYGLVDFDAPVLTTAPKSLGRLMLNILGTYPGSLGNYAGINLNIPVITLELPHAWVMPSESETAKLWEDIVRWLRNNVDNPTPTDS